MSGIDNEEETEKDARVGQVGKSPSAAPAGDRTKEVEVAQEIDLLYRSAPVGCLLREGERGNSG